MWEVSIDQLLGDLFLSGSCCGEGSPSPKRLCNAKRLYKSALDRLNLSDWATVYCASEESLMNDKSEFKVDPRRSRRAKKEAKPSFQKQDLVVSNHRRITRSIHRSLVEIHEIEQEDKGMAASSSLAVEHSTSLDSKNFSADFQSEIRSLCNKMKCWQCLHVNAGECSNLNIFISMNWELVHRKLSLRLLISIGRVGSFTVSFTRSIPIIVNNVL